MKSGTNIITYTGNKKYVKKFPICLENNVPTNGAITVKIISKPMKPTKTHENIMPKTISVSVWTPT